MNAIVRDIEKDAAAESAYGVLTDPTTLTLRRRVSGPVERVWAYLTDSDLRRRWLASGQMEMKVGAMFDLTWRNDELTTPPGRRPEGQSSWFKTASSWPACKDPLRRVPRRLWTQR